MKSFRFSRCRLLVALAVLFFSGLLAAQPSAQPMLAQAPAFSSMQDRGESSVQRSEMNTAAYVEIIVIPLLLFILMIGIVRRQDV